jgi:hypothetical protein
MYLDNILNGRKEKRLPSMVAVMLAPLGRKTANGFERTYTDNVSAHGLRVHSGRPWQRGELAVIAPVKGEIPIRGEVVYCHKLDDGKFFVGFKSPHSRVPWSVLRRFDEV